MFYPPRKVSFVLLVGLLVASLVLPSIVAPVFAAPGESTFSEVVPTELGEVIYRKNGDSPKQIYIIGQSHRSAVTGANGKKTVEAQAEIFRIGEWLIRKQDVRLLLPEGYFQKSAGQTVKTAAASGGVDFESIRLDDETLNNRLSDTSVFINADILLKNNYPVRLSQVENEKIYQAVGETMRSLQGLKGYGVPTETVQKIEYLQELRSAAMMQNIHRAVETQFNAGAIPNQRAIFNIGMAHLDEMIRFLDQEQIDIEGGQYSDLPEIKSVLDLLEDGYGVTVILPRTLLDDQEALKMARLDAI